MKHFSRRITAFFRKQRWIRALCFALSVLFALCGIVLCCFRGLGAMPNSTAFSIGADIFAMAACSALLYSLIQNGNSLREDSRIFVLLITMTSAVMFFDTCGWFVQGIPSLRDLNRFLNVLIYLNGALLIFYFWRYARASLELKGRGMEAANIVLNVLLVPTLIGCLVNFFYPLYFSVNEAGIYERAPLYLLSQGYLLIGMIIVTAGFFISKVALRERLVTASFVLIPVFNQLVTINYFGISTEYAAMMVSIVLIFGVLFSEWERRFASTEKELSVASTIQANMLPNQFPAFPERTDFDIHGLMDPAREVGGDFYDFFLLDEDHLAMAIADVSGKGVPASLFMMAVMILMRNHLKGGKSPKDVMELLNHQICANNPDQMFITIWLGILDLKTGILTAANAGHEYPYIKHPNGTFERIKDKHSIIIGGFEGAKYQEYEMRLERGTKLFVHTDGVPESTNIQRQLFGSERLLEALRAKENGTPREIVEEVGRAVGVFIGDAPQFDDLTMLCVEYRGKEQGSMKEITVEAACGNLDMVTDFVNAALEQAGCPIRIQTQVDIVIDEVFSNIAKYAYAPEKGTVTVRMETDDNEMQITFFDRGKPYNPLLQNDPDITLPVEKREAGGLGLLLVKKMMDNVRYEYLNGQNMLCLKKRF